MQLMCGGAMVGGKVSSLILVMVKMESTRFIFQVCTLLWFAGFSVSLVVCVHAFFFFIHLSSLNKYLCFQTESS